MTVGVPPVWVDVSEQISANMHRARMKKTELAKAHANALMPSLAMAKATSGQLRFSHMR